eukprot:GFKZ01004787.1.p1 GENE.GFKZ01004787.1~~GFKZ01004787.1.p1  ORF type:complete len:182 (-),score=39.44 GFKZ01004787.1:9-500(-)
MTNQSTDETVAPKVPKPCEEGCGFFGSDATGGCCSKCWMEKMKKNQSHSEPKSLSSDLAEQSAATTKEVEPLQEKERPRQQLQSTLPKETTTQVPPVQKTTETEEDSTASPPAVPKKKGKKKKKTYKSLMAGMMNGSKELDVKKERENIQGLGGGNFSKIEKI